MRNFSAPATTVLTSPATATKQTVTIPVTKLSSTLPTLTGNDTDQSTTPHQRAASLEISAAVTILMVVIALLYN